MSGAAYSTVHYIVPTLYSEQLIQPSPYLYSTRGIMFSNYATNNSEGISWKRKVNSGSAEFMV